MNPAGKALWFIENHFAEEIALAGIAKVAGVSRYHLSRAFGLATGYPVMRYIRGRRLTEAARHLADGAPDIFAVALKAGYNSHEAFTRAFRDQFGVTPELLRARGELTGIELMEPIKMDERLLSTLEPPKFIDGREMLIAGLSQRYNDETSAGMPAQWQRFAPYIGHVPGQIGTTTYGVLCSGEEGEEREYICGVEVSGFGGVPAELGRLRIPEQRYAIFLHRDHISTIRRTWVTIFQQWLPASGYEPAGAPEIEVYTDNFDPVSGMGGVEIRIPLKGGYSPPKL